MRHTNWSCKSPTGSPCIHRVVRKGEGRLCLRSGPCRCVDDKKKSSGNNTDSARGEIHGGGVK